jgi:hypothetical protein
MDGQPDILSSGPQWRRGARWPRPSRGGWIAIFVLAVLLACLGLTVSLALLAAHQDDTIDHLRAALRNTPQPAPATAALPAVSGSATFWLPDAGGGSFSVVVVAVRPGPGSAALTWLVVYGQHANPGQRYGLLSDTCGGQYVAAYDLAEGTADRNGDLTRCLDPGVPVGGRHTAWRGPGPADRQRRKNLQVGTAVLKQGWPAEGNGVTLRCITLVGRRRDGRAWR